MIRIKRFENTSTPFAIVTRHAGRAKQNVISFLPNAQGIVCLWGDYPHVVLFSHIEDAMAYEITYA